MLFFGAMAEKDQDLLILCQEVAIFFWLFPVFVRSFGIRNEGR